MKRGSLWLDWVELGCREWDLEPEGAGMDCDWQEGPGFRCHEGDYAHLDRQSLELLIAGCPAFVERVFRDLTAAGLYRQGVMGNPWVLKTCRYSELPETFTAGCDTESLTMPAP